MFTTDSNNADVSSKLLNILIEAVAPSTSGSNSDLCSLPLQSLSTIAMHAKIRLCMGIVELTLVEYVFQINGQSKTSFSTSSRS